MDPPRTPPQSARKVDGYIQDLNLKWRLLLPTGEYSPPLGTSVQFNEEIEAQKCVHYIRLLYFRDRIALDRVIKNFDDILRDSATLNGWIYKPNQEHSTLPKRSTAQTGSVLGRSDTSGPNRNLLMQQLLRFLQSEAEPLTARIRSTPSKSRVSALTTAATISTNSLATGQAGSEGPTEFSRGGASGLHYVTAVDKHSKQVEQDNYFNSMPGPSRCRLSEISAARFDDGSGNSGPSGPSTEMYESLCPPLEKGISSTKTRRAVAGVSSKNEHTHLGDLLGAPAKPNGMGTTQTSCTGRSRYTSMERGQRPIFGTAFYEVSPEMILT
jgi:hypothetical protein